MDMHTPQTKPDWMNKRPREINVWQRTAIASRGIVTPGNVLSLTGLIVVLLGAIKLYHQDWLPALLFLALGRAADLLDGYAAQLTGTKSRLGEIVDTTCDKVGVFAIVIAALLGHVIPWFVIVPIALYHLGLALFAVIWAQRYHLHTTRYGKLAMAASWLVILAVVFRAYMPNPITLAIAILLGLVFAGLALASIYTYYQALRKVTFRLHPLAAWTHEVSDVLHIYNPRASNYPRARRILAELRTRTGWKVHAFDLRKQRDDIKTFIASHKAGETLLVAISGGDGTVSGAVNLLAELDAAGKIPKLYVLPLWGGNANDFSYMLNGVPDSTKPSRILTNARPLTLPLIQLDVTTKKRNQTLYACCYASFGASAFTARKLESRRFSTSSIFRWFPPLLVLREFIFVIRAMIDSPLRVAEINHRETSFYEHTLINGSRIAKVNRIPVQIDEPVFFHALVERKHPSVLITMLRILLRKPDVVYAKESKLEFTTRQQLDAQIDGEVIRLAKGADVSAQIMHPKKILFLSSNLPSAPS
jgi:phosphatidylglycerophosphate synthase/diacylglycerol kinase family enzyme